VTKKVLPYVVEAVLFLALGFLLVGCGEGKADPKAEAPPPATVEREQDASVFKVDHPDQFPLAIVGWANFAKLPRESRPEF